MTAAPFTALVLAASRPGDPVARACGVSHKALVPAGGEPMLARVLAALRASPSVGRIAVCIEDAALLERLPGAAETGVEALPSAATPGASVLEAVARLGEPFPLLVTTADHALLTPAMVDRFCAAARASGADLAAGLAPASVIRRAYPAAQRTFLRFREDGYSGCNLFALLAPAALRAVRFWTVAERDRKRPWRLVRRFGPGSLLLFALGRLTLDQAMQRASRVLETRVTAVRMEDAEAAIDVDKPADLELVETILRNRLGPQRLVAGRDSNMISRG